MSSGNRPSSARELLLARAPAIKHASAAPVPAYAEELTALWAALRDDPGCMLQAAPALVARIRETLEANRQKLETRESSALMERLAHVIPEPAVALSARGYTWNVAFANEFAHEADPHSLIREELAPLERILQGLLTVELPALLYPLGRRIFSLRLVRLEDEGLSLAYFFPTALQPPALPHRIRFLLCARLSGMAAKQIAPLLGATKDQVDGWAKRFRKDLQALKAQMANQVTSELNLQITIDD